MRAHPRHGEMLLHGRSVEIDRVGDEGPTIVDELAELPGARLQELEHAQEPLALGVGERLAPESGVGKKRLHARRPDPPPSAA